jgi:hypothetical protein
LARPPTRSAANVDKARRLQLDATQQIQHARAYFSLQNGSSIIILRGTTEGATDLFFVYFKFIHKFKTIFATEYTEHTENSAELCEPVISLCAL